MTQAQGKTGRYRQLSQIHAAALYLCAVLLAGLSLAPVSPLLNGVEHPSFRKAIPTVDHNLRDESLARASRISPDEQSSTSSSAPPHVALVDAEFAFAVSVGLQSRARACASPLPHRVRSAHHPRAPPALLA